MKIVVSRSYGGIVSSLRDSGIAAVFENKTGIKLSYGNISEHRTNTTLVQIVEDLLCANKDTDGIEVVDIPDDVEDWYISDFDGYETVREGRTW